MADFRGIVRHKTPLAYLANDVVWFAMRAFRDSAIVHLWKVYDTQPQARSLRWFVRAHSVADDQTQSQDLLSIALSQPDVKRLEQLRHLIFAHRGAQAVAAGADATLEANNLSETEFDGLIQRATAVLRRHYGTYLHRQLWHDYRDAISQLTDLDVFLEGTHRGMWGIERFVPDIDGSLRQRAKDL